MAKKKSKLFKREDEGLDFKKISTSDFSGGGILNNEQTKKFVTFLEDESIVMKLATTKVMSAPVMELSYLLMDSAQLFDEGGHVIRRKGECVAPPASGYVTVSGAKQELITTSLVVPIEICWELIEDNIEGKKLEETLLKQVAVQMANDLEELLINGDTTDTDPFLSIMDGVRASDIPNENEADCSMFTNKVLNKAHFNKVLKHLPTRYRRNRSQLVFGCSSDNEQDYRYSLTGRDTSYGDNSLINDDLIKVFGIKILPIPALGDSTLVLLNPKNIIVGIWSKLRLERDTDIFAGKNQFAMHMRLGFLLANPLAIAMTHDIVPGTMY